MHPIRREDDIAENRSTHGLLHPARRVMSWLGFEWFDTYAGGDERHTVTSGGIRRGESRR